MGLAALKIDDLEMFEISFPGTGVHLEIKFKTKEKGCNKLSEEITRSLHTSQSGINFFYYNSKTYFL